MVRMQFEQPLALATALTAARVRYGDESLITIVTGAICADYLAFCPAAIDLQHVLIPGTPTQRRLAVAGDIEIVNDADLVEAIHAAMWHRRYPHGMLIRFDAEVVTQGHIQVFPHADTVRVFRSFDLAHTRSSQGKYRSARLLAVA